MTAYQRFQKLNIDHSVIGLDQNISGVNYFCTPIGAEVIAEAGVDGIQYCFIKGFGEMIFAISPSDILLVVSRGISIKGQLRLVLLD